jgi:PleD family two-component response regulator
MSTPPANTARLRPIDTAAAKLPAAVSVGLTQLERGKTFESALNCADTVLYNGKKSGGSWVVTCDALKMAWAKKGLKAA